MQVQYAQCIAEGKRWAARWAILRGHIYPLRGLAFKLACHVAFLILVRLIAGWLLERLI